MIYNYLVKILLPVFCTTFGLKSFLPYGMRKVQDNGFRSERIFPTRVFLGNGIANDYSWKEDQFDIDITIKVPKDTSSEAVEFRSYTHSVELRLSKTILLDGKRKFRNKINIDGTFWSISDGEDSHYRDVIVHLEKYKAPLDDLEVDEDWGGVYPDDDDEVLERVYDSPEELDVDEYCKSLGIDINNINMSMVDKSMFSSMNFSKNALESLQSDGLLKEFTVQSDGAHLEGEDYQRTGATPLEQESIKNIAIKEFTDKSYDTSTRKDPIDTLTVARLKDILRSQQLKVSGNKQELRDRLRFHVQSRMNNKENSEETNLTSLIK